MQINYSLRIMPKLTCNVCGKDWRSAAAYCPRCGSPVLVRPRWSMIWEMTIVAATSLLIFWLTSKGH
jgi:predicted amidophosphoribosyltransferase